MSKKQKEQTININDKEYKQSDLNETQMTMINHIQDLDRKLQSAEFNLEQLQFGRDSFMNGLTTSLQGEQHGK